MKKSFGFTIEKRLPKGGGRAGTITTPHGTIQTPAFIVVGTKATVKAVTVDQVQALGAQAILANTYHLYLRPGSDILRQAGGLGNFMRYSGPTFTDSGGFQAFSLGAAFQEEGTGRRGVSKVRRAGDEAAVVPAPAETTFSSRRAKITEDGVTFFSHIDGSQHLFTPESSMAIQHDIGADIMFAFDECTSPHEPYEYQKEALARTHRWAERSLAAHAQGVSSTGQPQALYGVVQGGRFEDLRQESARTLGAMPFDGFGIGGSFDKDDIGTAVSWVNALLPEGKPRHLLGIGEPVDMVLAVEQGIDTFDCVLPTRLARNGTLYTRTGRINILNAEHRTAFEPIEKGCTCAVCAGGYTRAYLSHLFRADEMLGATLASIHNVTFLVGLVAEMRQHILNDTFAQFKTEFLAGYKG
jgi:queuine tRNA-ribosyltransferase